MSGYHFNSSLRVDRISEKELKSDCVILSTERECRGWLLANVADLKIAQAGWAEYRTAESDLKSGDIAELIGVEAFLNSGPRLKEALPGKEKVAIRELISECIRGLVQAETYFYKERGFNSAAEYDGYWDKMYLNRCHYYSHLDQVEKPWLEYVGDSERSGNLFNRIHSVTIHSEKNGTFLLFAVFIDSFHELEIRLELDEEGIITGAEASYNRAPDKICWNNAKHLSNLPGLNLPLITKKELASLAGGTEGCHHLVDLLHYASRTMTEFMAMKPLE